MTNLWKRVEAWLPGHDVPDDGDRAVRALGDVTTMRHVLGQVEMEAVRVARRHNKSWSEIATMLDITRQSAWERWRDLEDDGPKVAPTDDAAPQPNRVGRIADAAAHVVARARRSGGVDVPDVVGLTSSEALGILTGAGLDAVSATPEIDLIETPDEQRQAMVVRQYPDPGTRVPGASTVRLWLERGDGSAGVREPRRPLPPSRVDSDELELPGDRVG